MDAEAPETADTSCRVRIAGPRLDASNAAIVRMDVRALIDQGATDLVLDMSEVDFMDSSGLGALVGVAKYLGSAGTVRLAGVRDGVGKVLRITRLDKVLTIDDAVSS